VQKLITLRFHVDLAGQLGTSILHATEQVLRTDRDYELGERPSPEKRTIFSTKRILKENTDMPQPGSRILRITKEIQHSSDDAAYFESNGKEITEDDNEILHRSLNNSQYFRVFYDVVHSPSYQVPVLYVTFEHGVSDRGLPSLEQAYDLLAPQSLQIQMQQIGVMGALSTTDHPATGTPAIFVHPCQTAAAMDDVAGRGEIAPGRYLLLWIGLIGCGVGLDVPTELAWALSTPTAVNDVPSIC
jgi:ubiquitin-like-conjugating enzyme ATG10